MKQSRTHCVRQVTMSETGYVYTLTDPRTDTPKYVGATMDPQRRLSGHISSPNTSEMAQWLDELNDAGHTPTMTLIETATKENLADAEKEAIKRMGEEFTLFNTVENVRDQWGETETNWVKAQVTEETHRYLKVQAAKYDMTVEEVTAQILNVNTPDRHRDGSLTEDGELKHD